MYFTRRHQGKKVPAWIGNLYNGTGIASAEETCDIELPLTTDIPVEEPQLYSMCSHHGFVNRCPPLSTDAILMQLPLVPRKPDEALH